MRTKTRESAAPSAEKKMMNEYAKYVKTVDASKAPMSFSEFSKDFEKMQAEKEVADKIVLSDIQKDTITALGWTLEEHTPVSGPNAGKTGFYLINNDAKVNGSGFLHFKKSRLENTLERLEANAEVIRVALGLVKL